MSMKIPMQSEVGDYEIEFGPAASGNPAHLQMVLHLRRGGEFVGVEVPRIWFDHAFLRDVGLEDG